MFEAAYQKMKSITFKKYYYKDESFIYKIMDRQQEYVNAYIQKQREKKHRQIMNAITSYKRTPEQIKMLDKVKHATRMEIDLRFKNCAHNQAYKFPFLENAFDSQFQEQQFPNPNIVLYDLCAQAEVIKKSLSTKTLSLDAGRRVKSLQRQQIPEQQQLINKIKRRPLQIGPEPAINEYLGRKNSLKDRRVRNRSNFKLPQLKKLNNESRNNLQQIVGKKINTQTSSPESKRLAKFLRGVQSDGKQLINKDMSKKFFLKKV